MSKFKVGDEVKVIAAKHADKIDLVGSTFKITDVDGKFYDTHETAYLDGPSRFRWRESELELVVPSGPVRTVTRREIVPGCYGRVSVQGDIDGYVSVCLTGPMGGNHKEDHARSLSASDLRSAAMIFSQLAEALDDNADNA